MAYANGQVPFSVLIHLGANFWLPAGTAARWLWFVAEGVRRFGVTFRITPDRDGLGGWNAYRPYSAQVVYKKHYGNMAASAGFSSHGGFYQGREVFAIDVDNWASVSWAAFSGLAAEAGFRTNFVTPTERWHIGDFNNPWVVPAFAAGYSKDDDMTPEQDALLKNIAAFLYGGGTSVSDPNYVGMPGTIYNLLKTPVQRSVDGKAVKIPQIQELADAKTIGIRSEEKLDQLLSRPAAVITDAQVKIIADAVAKQVGAPTVNIDYAKIAKDVRAEFRADPLVAS